MQTLILVYNADSGYLNGLFDALHKVISPDTYECKLCALTHGALSMRSEWKTFLESLGLPIEFLHRDEFKAQYGKHETEMPAIFLQTADASPTVLISADEIEACESLEALKHKVETSLNLSKSDHVRDGVA